VPGHEGIVGNDTADLLARTGSEHPFTGPYGVTVKKIMVWAITAMKISKLIETPIS
jgi:hypothetical protein